MREVSVPSKPADARVAIAVTGEVQWRALCGAMGQPALADDPRFTGLAARKANEEALDEIVARWVAPQERWEVTRRLHRRWGSRRSLRSPAGS